MARHRRNNKMHRRFSLVMLVNIIAFGLVAASIAYGLTRHDDRPAASGHQTSGIAPDTAWMSSLTNAASHFDGIERVDREVSRFMAKWGLRGLSIAMTRNDSLIFAQGFGMADQNLATPMEPSTIMRIASASKLVTAIAIMKLVEQKKLTLDSKVFGLDGILNDSVFTGAIRDKRILDITVDHLLLHEGGFGRGAGDPMFRIPDIVRANKLSAAPDSRTLTKIVLGRRLAFAPGTSSRYSNFGYMLLSLIVEKASDEDYWSYVTDNVLLPAGVGDMRPANNYLSERYPNEARYYGPDDEIVEAYDGSGKMVERVYGGNDIHGLLGAGGWLASAPGLARLIAAVDGITGVDDILSQSSIDTMVEQDGKVNKARGWVSVDGRGNWIRTGTLSSTHALIKRKKDGETWVLLTNTGVWTGFRFNIELNHLADKLSTTIDWPTRNLW